MSDTPYREPPALDAPRPPRPDPLAEETENPPHVRAAGALLATNALIGVALGAAQARAGLPVAMGVLVFAAVIDIPIGFGLWTRAPRLVRPAGLRRFAAFRLVCGMGVAVLGVRASPAATALSLCASLACLVLLSRTVTRARVVASALAQVFVLLASAWLLVWTERGQRLFWGVYEHARGGVGASAAGTNGGGARPFTIEAPSGWYHDREMGASGDLRLVAPEWGGVVLASSTRLEWDNGPNTPEGFRRAWTNALDRRGILYGEVEPMDIDGAIYAARVPVIGHGRRDWLYAVLKRDGDVLVTGELALPGELVEAHPTLARTMLGSLRPHGRSAAALAAAPDAPIAALPAEGLALIVPGWTLHPPAGWWGLSASTRASFYGADSTVQGLAVPFERTVVGVFVTDHFEVGEIEAWVRAVQGVVRVSNDPYAAVPEAREFVGYGDDSNVLCRVLVVPRGGGFLVTQEFGAGMPERRARELADMLRTATFPMQP
jgi:hypothetical protein